MRTRPSRSQPGRVAVEGAVSSRTRLATPWTLPVSERQHALVSNVLRLYHTAESSGIILISRQTEVSGVGRLAREVAGIGS